MFFCPWDNTPGWTYEAQAFNVNLEQFSKLSADVIGNSSDEGHADFVSKYGLKMKLLSDVGGKASNPPQRQRAWREILAGSFTVDKTDLSNIHTLNPPGGATLNTGLLMSENHVILCCILPWCGSLLCVGIPCLQISSLEGRYICRRLG